MKNFSFFLLTLLIKLIKIKLRTYKRLGEVEVKSLELFAFDRIYLGDAWYRRNNLGIK